MYLAEQKSEWDIGKGAKDTTDRIRLSGKDRVEGKNIKRGVLEPNYRDIVREDIGTGEGKENIPLSQSTKKGREM